MIVQSNIPQWVLDIFNRIDFKKIPYTKKILALAFLEKWGNQNLYSFNPEKKYTYKQRVINKNFDLQLLKLLSKYDYDGVSDLQKTLLKANLSKWEKQFNIPVKNNYESIAV